jgi:hypothetical protein
LHTRLMRTDDLCANVLLLIMVLIYGCQPPGIVTNRQKFNTHLNSIKLNEFPALKVYYGGAICEIPLKSLQELVIDHSNVIQYDDELYFGAKIVLKNGMSIKSNQNDSKFLPYVSVQNTIIGRHNSETFQIGLQDVARIEILQR